MSQFKFPWAMVLEVCAELVPGLERLVWNICTLTDLNNYWIPYKWLLTMTINRWVGDIPPLGAIISDILVGIIKLTNRYIRVPYMVSEETNSKAYLHLSGFPNLIRADWTLVAIVEQIQNFIKWKQLNSINEVIFNYKTHIAQRTTATMTCTLLHIQCAPLACLKFLGVVLIRLGGTAIPARKKLLDCQGMCCTTQHGTAQWAPPPHLP